jgi:predicted ester cyclase
MRATQIGDLPGIPGTGKPVTVTSIIIYRISKGKIAEEWESWDALGMMQQLGVSRLPGRPSGDS